MEFTSKTTRKQFAKIRLDAISMREEFIDACYKKLKELTTRWTKHPVNLSVSVKCVSGIMLLKVQYASAPSPFAAELYVCTCNLIDDVIWKFYETSLVK